MSQLLIAAVRDCLTPDLLKPPFTGHCYVASEALYHLLGGKEAGYRPVNLRHENVQHWWLEGPSGVLDPTADQFKTPVPYEQGRGRGFLTKQPSKRAQKLIDDVRIHIMRETMAIAVQEAIEEMAYQEQYGGMFISLTDEPIGSGTPDPDSFDITPIPVKG